MVVRHYCGKCQVLLLSHPCCLSEPWYLDLIRMDFSAHTHTQNMQYLTRTHTHTQGENYCTYIILNKCHYAIYLV